MLLQMVGSKLLVGTRSYSLVEVVGSSLAINKRTYKINLCLVRQSVAKLCEIMLFAKPMLCQSLSWGV